MNILLLNQAFYPDVVSSGQHATDLAKSLAAAGHNVTVIASARGYDDPSRRFKKRETWNGIKIIRVPSSFFGKGRKWHRASDFGTFLLGCLSRLMFLPSFDAVLAMTSPPLVCALATLFVRIRGGALLLWVMDLQPDLAIAAGWLQPNSRVARLLKNVLITSCRQASKIIVLDRHMKDRIASKGIGEDKIAIVPPWSHDEAVRFDLEGRDAFRKEQGLSGKYTVMYSGNHSPCHPLTTIVEAAVRLKDDSRFAFCFVGGGSEHSKIAATAKELKLSNVVCLPYQPLDQLSGSLSAADLHVVAMGDPYVGIVHPCKVYNILSLGIPFLYLGPANSHLTDMVPAAAIGKWVNSISHGDVEGVVNTLLQRVETRESVRYTPAMALAKRFSEQALLPKMLNIIEASIAPQPVPARIPEVPQTVPEVPQTELRAS